jgi:hypothetical protein
MLQGMQTTTYARSACAVYLAEVCIMNMAICVQDCQFSAGNLIVTYNAVLADGC